MLAPGIGESSATIRALVSAAGATAHLQRERPTDPCGKCPFGNHFSVLPRCLCVSALWWEATRSIHESETLGGGIDTWDGAVKLRGTGLRAGGKSQPPVQPLQYMDGHREGFWNIGWFLHTWNVFFFSFLFSKLITKFPLSFRGREQVITKSQRDLAFLDMCGLVHCYTRLPWEFPSSLWL